MTPVLSRIGFPAPVPAENQQEEGLTFPPFPTSFWGTLRQRFLGISLEEASFARRGFCAGDAEKQQHLEKIGSTFLQGYNAAIASDNLETLILQLNGIEAEVRGFAFEGAAMGLAILDYLTPGKRDAEGTRSDRVRQFITGAGGDHIYMTYVGIGWSLARLPGRLHTYLAQLQPTNPKSKIQNPKSIDSLLGWLALDGYGFHQGYFYWRDYVEGSAIPNKLSGYACRAFDQGLGRSLWFVKGADVTAVIEAIRAFQSNRRGDLWSGVGLACTYAGGVGQEEIRVLQQGAGDYRSELAQGAAFAAKTRLRAGNLAGPTEMASQILCGMPAEAAAAITDAELVGLADEGTTPAYEIWRRRIQAHFLPIEASL